MGKRKIGTANFNKHICQKILTYLRSKLDKKDSLDGILLGIYEDEIRKLSNVIFKNLGYLISIGVIQEVEGPDQKICYRLMETSKNIDQIFNL